jgi:hypothetical protein
VNLNPAIVLDPVFHFLDEIVVEYGLCLFLAFVWLCLLVLAWVFSGGLRRRFPNQPHVRASIGIVIQPQTPSPTQSGRKNCNLKSRGKKEQNATTSLS